MKRVLVFLAILGLCATGAFAQTAAPTAPPAAATPSTGLLRYSGQLLDVQRGFAFFTTGDAFRLAPGVKIVDARTGAATAQLPATRTFARASFDGSGQIVELAISSKPLPAEATYLDAHKYAVAFSSPAPNPELDPNRPRTGPPGSAPRQSRIPLTGKIVPVRFLVRVPPNTKLSDPVYMSTDVAGWNATAIRMERVDGLHYAVTLPLRTGTEFAYKYTRGSWRSAERGRTGIEAPARSFFLDATEVGEPDTKLRDDVVYNWSDDNPGGGVNPISPDAIPTPFNSRPFGFPTPFPRVTPGPKRS